MTTSETFSWSKIRRTYFYSIIIYRKINIFYVKSIHLLKKLLKSWFHERFWAWSHFIVPFQLWYLFPSIWREKNHILKISNFSWKLYVHYCISRIFYHSYKIPCLVHCMILRNLLWLYRFQLPWNWNPKKLSGK